MVSFRQRRDTRNIPPAIEELIAISLRLGGQEAWKPESHEIFKPSSLTATQHPSFQAIGFEAVAPPAAF
jgi:hypothetical protein